MIPVAERNSPGRFGGQYPEDRLPAARIKKKIKEAMGSAVKRACFMSPFSKRLNAILMYHRVVKDLPEEMHEPAVFVTADVFDLHLAQVSEVFELVPLTDLIEHGKREKGLCAVTFDDGWLDTYEVAFPILKRYSAPATVFVPTGLIGTESPFWFEDLMALGNRMAEKHSAKEFVDYFSRVVPAWKPSLLERDSICGLISHMKGMPPEALSEILARAHEDLGMERIRKRSMIGWDHMAEMGRSNISFGPHGSRHFILPALDSRIKRREIFEPLKALLDHGVNAVPIYSFPNGGWDHECIALLAEAGYKGAVTTGIGYNDRRTNPFLLKRIGMHDYISSTPSLFWFRMCQAFFEPYESAAHGACHSR